MVKGNPKIPAIGQHSISMAHQNDYLLENNDAEDKRKRYKKWLHTFEESLHQLRKDRIKLRNNQKNLRDHKMNLRDNKKILRNRKINLRNDRIELRNNRTKLRGCLTDITKHGIWVTSLTQNRCFMSVH